MTRQQGFALFELLLATVLVTLLAVWGVHAMVQRMHDAAVGNDAAWALAVRGALKSFLSRHEQDIAVAAGSDALVVSGFPDWSEPTLAQLRTAGFLPATFPESALPGGAVIRLFRQGVCPSPDCRVHVVLHARQPYLQGASLRVDESRVAQWLMATEGWGGAVQPLDPGRIRGPAFSFANPPWAGPALAPGTPLVALTSEQVSTSHFLRLGDPRNPDFQGDASVQGTFSVASHVQVQGALRLQRKQVAGTACSTPGDLVSSFDASLLVCRDGFWTPVAAQHPGGFSMNQFHDCSSSQGLSTANPVTGDCSCPVGAAMVQISDSGPQAWPEGRTQGFLCVP